MAVRWLLPLAMLGLAACSPARSGSHGADNAPSVSTAVPTTGPATTSTIAIATSDSAPADQITLTVDLDRVTPPGRTHRVATAELPAPASAPSATRTDTLAAFIPDGDAESFGPSVIATSDTAVYVADPVNRRISRYASDGTLTNVDLDMSTNYLRDLSAMAVDERNPVIYLQVNDTVHAIDLNGSGERWRSQVAGAVYRSLVAVDDRVSVLVGGSCAQLDSATGQAVGPLDTSGLCVIPDVRPGSAQVLFRADGHDVAMLSFKSAGTIVRVEVGAVDLENRTFSGTVFMNEDGAQLTKAFVVGVEMSATMILPESTDHRFSTAMPVTDAAGATGVWYSDGVIEVAQIEWGKH